MGATVGRLTGASIRTKNVGSASYTMFWPNLSGTVTDQAELKWRFSTKGKKWRD